MSRQYIDGAMSFSRKLFVDPVADHIVQKLRVGEKEVQ